MIEIVDNFLEQDQFLKIQSSIINNRQFPFYIAKGVTSLSLKENNYYLAHLLYSELGFSSNFYDLVFPILKKISPIIVKRIKVNFYPVTSTIQKHDWHCDYKKSHKGCIFYLNTNNGKTILESGEEVESIENRMLFFDPSKNHRSTTCTDDFIGRFNINFNYI